MFASVFLRKTAKETVNKYNSFRVLNECDYGNVWSCRLFVSIFGLKGTRNLPPAVF